MDQLFVNIIGKPKLNPSGRIITLVAENFPMLEDQARFLRATLAIPIEKQLPLNDIKKVLVQMGPLHNTVKIQLEKTNYSVVPCDELISRGEDSESFCKRLHEEVSKTNDRQLIVINDASRIQLSLGDRIEWRKFLRLLYRWRHSQRHFVVVLYQQSLPVSPEATAPLYDLEYISDARLATRSFRHCYLQSMWFCPVDRPIKTLIPPKVETQYYTCKIGKSYWSPNLLCFYERNQVVKGFDPDSQQPNATKSDVGSLAKLNKETNSASQNPDRSPLETILNKVGLDDDDEDESSNSNLVTLPYIKAQNPEQSRIFYYPDKDDDVDEDDPDDDLGI